MRKISKLALGTAALLVTGAVVLMAEGRNITVKGSDTMVILGQRWAEVFMSKNPGLTIQITGGGSGTGIAALINGTTDICEASRPMKDAEKAEANPISELTLAQIKSIYTGVVKNWKDVGGSDQKIILYSRENNSGTYVYFKEHVLENGDYYPTAQTLPGTAAVINAVAKDQRGIGYGGIAYGKGIKHLNIKKDANSPAIAPTMENVLAAKYPI